MAMVESFQAASLVASPSYADAVAWSNENLLAVACGHIITILNPTMPFGPRGLIILPTNIPFQIGVVERKDSWSHCLLPISLSRDNRPCARSISWSPIGFASNSGCLLAICTTEGRVKIYRFPFGEFSAEWIEVVDISDMLFIFLASINFREDLSSKSSDERTNKSFAEHESVGDLPIAAFRDGRKRRKRNALAANGNADFSLAAHNKKILTASQEESPVSTFALQEGALTTEIDSMNCEENNSRKIIPVPDSKSQKKREPEKCGLPVIASSQYASRRAILSSLVVAWSPILHAVPKAGVPPTDNPFHFCSILAVGAKSGIVSLWRINNPKSYSPLHGRDPSAALLVGFIQAHISWVTSISWAFSVPDASNPQLLLVTGSCDGSVKIWVGNIDKLINFTEVSHSSFSLLKEVMSIDSMPVSVLSVIVPEQSQHKMLLAVGKGSGFLIVWICDISRNNFSKAGSYDAHDHIVTGLAWAFDACCLYSCSQDNSMRSWVLHENSLREVPFPSNTPGLKGSTDVPDVFDSCFGLATSPGNLILAVARGFDTDLLNPMYQVRTQKAAVEFFLIGGQQRDSQPSGDPDINLGGDPDINLDVVSSLPAEELVSWEHNVLWCLSLFENPDRQLVVWDVITVLLAFMETAPKYMERILLKWLKHCVGLQLDISVQMELHLPEFLSKRTSRQLQLLNIVSRRVVLTDLTTDKINKLRGIGNSGRADQGYLNIWTDLLLSSEEELRARLVGLSFSAFVKSEPSSQAGSWYPEGLSQIEQWLALNHEMDRLKFLSSEIGKLDKSKMKEYVRGEVCTYCEAPVPFESPEFALCNGTKSSDGGTQSHRLARCAVSMRVCPSTPSWFCVCCERRVSQLPPEALFKISEFRLDFRSLPDFPTTMAFSKPLCPFCGILLCRLQPEFLLSPSPV